MCPKKLNSVTYKKSMLDSAVEAVMSGTFTMKQSASVYGVPVASISNILRKKGYSSKKKKDVDQLAQIDKQLMDWLQLMSEISCFSLRNQMADIINEVFERFGQKVKLDGKSGQMQWIDRFVERQPEVLKASLEAESGVTGISSEHIDEWTRKLKNHLFHAHNIEVQEFAQQSNAGNVFCCFEVGSVFFSGNKHSFRLLYKPSQGHVEGEFIMSLYSCICADGTFLKPVAIVKDETLIQTTMETGVRDFHILSSSEGKMSCEAAMLWMQLIDVETQPKKGHTSFLIFLDQTIRPLSLATLDFCRQRELILFYLPGHYPNMKLPFGMDIFYNLNGEYDNILASDDAKDGEVTVESALELLMEAWKMMLKTNSNVTEFHDFGLVPLDSGVMKSTVEEIVPLTMSPTEGAFEAQEGAETPASSAHVPNTPSTDASSSSCFPNASLQSNDDIAVNLHPVRPARIPPKNYKETSETDNETEEPVEGILANTGMTVPTTAENFVSDLNALTKKPNLKIKIKRSERIPNTFSVEPNAILPSKQSGDGNNDGLSGRKSSSDNFTSCDQCDKARDHGLRSGVVQGLVFALKRIESSLRADTLNLYKSRYLSPYLNDHRPSEPSFVMWCELMKCLEMGPDAVQKDFLLARSIQNNSGFEARSRECGSTNSYKSGSCLSDVTSDASVLPHLISKNKKRTRSPGLQESETVGVLSQDCFTRNDSAAFANTVTGNILALHNVNDLSKPKTNKHDLYSTKTGQNQRLANGQTHGVSEREISDFNSNDHLNNSVHFPYKGFTPAANSGMKNQGRESFGSLHCEAQFSCNNQEPLDVSSAPDYREGMFPVGHKGAQGQNLEPHSLRPQFRPPRNVPPQTIPSPNQRPQFDSGPPIFHQQPQHSTPAGFPIQHQPFQRGEQSQQDPYSLLTKIDQTQPQKGWHPSQPNEPQESYASTSQQQQQQQQQQQHRMYPQLHHQERKDSCNASMQSKYDYQTGSTGVPSMAVHSENCAHTTQRTGDVSQEIIIDEPVILPCKSKIPGSHSVQQSCTPKKNITSPRVTSTPKSADSQTLASQVQRPPLPAAQSIESSQPSIVNNLNGSSNHDGGAAHLQANLQQHNRPLSAQYEIEDHPPVSNNQTSFSNSRPAHPSCPSVMPPPTNLSSSTHNLTDDGPSQLFVRGSEEQKHQQPGFRQDNVPRYQAHLPGNPGGDFNRPAYYPFSGRNQPPSTSSQVSSNHTFAPNSYGPNTTQTLPSYNQTMPQTGGYSNGFNRNSNEQSHPTDFHLAYQFSGLQQHNQSPHQIPQHQQYQQHPQVHHLQQQQQQQQQQHQQQLLSQSQQHQHMQNSPNVLHMSATGHPAPLPASRAVEGGHTTSEIKVEQYTNL